jgi:crossover junction endodeoxyribonuclease RuvC
MIILGIDPGIGRTGWAIVKKDNNPQLIKYGCIETSKKDHNLKRLKQLYEELNQLIKIHKPDVVATEKLFFNTNVTTAIKVGEARGVIKLAAILNKLKLTEFTPLQIKMSVVGYGRASKKQVQEMVKTLLNLKKIPKPDDAADAVAAALTQCFFNSQLA